MDLPLNLAHQEERKAERYLSVGKFAEAVLCHQKAADHLLLALQASSTPAVKESLELQYNNHIKQQEIVVLKQKQQELLMKATSKNTSKTEIGSKFKKSDSHKELEPNSDTDSSELNNYLIYRTIAETDSLLQIINNHGQSTTAKASAVFDTQVNKLVQESDVVPVKMAKSDNIIIEELRTHNEELCKMLKQYISKYEHLERENLELRQKLSRYGALVNSSSTELFSSLLPVKGMHIADDETLELPPLDEPKFDFDAFKDFEAS